MFPKGFQQENIGFAFGKTRRCVCSFKRRHKIKQTVFPKCVAKGSRLTWESEGKSCVRLMLLVEWRNKSGGAE